MTHFMHSGDAFMPSKGQDAVLDALPVGNYTVAESLMGLFFQEAKPFEDEGKSYGELDDLAERIMTTYLARARGTGVLLAGEKGSGKTRLARLLSRIGAGLNMPTIIINQPWSGDAFVGLLRSVDRPIIVLLDEFEKVYDKEQQEQVLTMLDGTMTPHALFILTVNDTWGVNTNMKNRPGRLFYNLEFDGISTEFVRDYCNDVLDDKEQIEAVLQATALFEKFNFDMLKALVEEMNRYKESPFDALKMLNAKPVTYGAVTETYTVTAMTKDGIKAKAMGRVTHNPLTHPHRALGLMFKVKKKGLDKKKRDWLDEMLGDDSQVHVVINADDVRRMDAERGLYEFETQEGYVVRFSRDEHRSRDMRDLAW